MDRSENFPKWKGQCHEIFCFGFFSWIIFPQAPENNTRVILNIFVNLQRYSQVKDTDDNFATSGVPLIPVANLQIAARINDTGGKLDTSVNDTGGNQWEQYQNTDNLKWTWRKNFFCMLTLLLKGVQKK